VIDLVGKKFLPKQSGEACSPEVASLKLIEEQYLVAIC
jgi:hypothetical protein